MMTESIRLGRIAGVSVGLNWSVVVIFLLIAGSLAFGYLPFVHEDLPTSAHVAAGLVTAVVFFLSLLAHEMAHAIVALRNGLEVEGITLWLFGGVAKLGGEAHDPGADLRIAGVGPLVSVVLGIAFFGLALVADAIDVHELVVTVLVWLGVINVILAVFNLMPAAPLDGGRILRAFLWRRRGDRISASITASRAGRVFGFVLIAIGLIEFAFTGRLGGLWFVLIGWFLTSAASAEEQHARVRGALGGLKVGDVMTPNPTVVPPWLTVDDLIEDFVFGHRYSTFPLVDDYGHPVGLVTLNRLKDVPRGERSAIRVADVACSPDEVSTASPGEELVDVLPRMRGCGDGRVLVVDGGRLVGILSPTDVARLIETADLRDAHDSRHI
jgi:Zn-dependent protease/CBS domain-containing protein